MKITGAHDFNDYAVARRHELGLISVMDEQGRMAGPIPQRYLGQDRSASISSRTAVFTREASSAPSVRSCSRSFTALAFR